MNFEQPDIYYKGAVKDGKTWVVRKSPRLAARSMEDIIANAGKLIRVWKESEL